MMNFSIIDKNSHYGDVRVQYKKLGIDHKTDSSYFFYYLEKEKLHFTKAEVFTIYIVNILNKIIQLQKGEEFIFYFDYYDEYTGGVKVERDSSDSFSIQEIQTGWGALNPHNIDGSRNLEYKLLGHSVSENRTDFLLGLLQSIEELLRANDKSTS